jgi:hypothetical protein
MVIYDIAYPASKDEFDALGGWTFVLFSALTHDPNELPLKRVYIRSKTGTADLQVAAAHTSVLSDKDADVASRLGRYRYDALCYMPVEFSLLHMEVLVDFASARTNFQIGAFPAPGADESIPQGVEFGGGPGTPNEEAAERLAHREFPFMFQRPDQHHTE